MSASSAAGRPSPSHEVTAAPKDEEPCWTALQRARGGLCGRRGVRELCKRHISAFERVQRRCASASQPRLGPGERTAPTPAVAAYREICGGWHGSEGGARSPSTSQVALTVGVASGHWWPRRTQSRTPWSMPCDGCAARQLETFDSRVPWSTCSPAPARTPWWLPPTRRAGDSASCISSTARDLGRSASTGGDRHWCRT